MVEIKLVAFAIMIMTGTLAGLTYFVFDFDTLPQIIVPITCAIIAVISAVVSIGDEVLDLVSDIL